MGVRSAAKVAVKFCRGGNIPRVLRSLRKTPTLVSCVEESPVLDDRTAYGCPELVLPQYGGTVTSNRAGNRVLVEVGKGIAGIEGIITNEFPRRSVKLIGAGLGNHAHHTAHGPTELGLVVVALHFEFVNGIDAREDAVHRSA